MIPLPDSWRDKIRVSKIMSRLESGCMGELELTSEQIAAAKLILSKVVPDLARTELTGKDGGDIKINPVGSLMALLTPDLRGRILEKIGNAPED